jgi:hypothetical protein
MKTRISFDFDGCLASYENLESMAKHLQCQGVKVYILTNRCKETGNKDLFEIAQRCRIPKKRILMACMHDKWRFIERYKITVHFDDDPTEVDVVNENLPGRAVLVGHRDAS